MTITPQIEKLSLNFPIPIYSVKDIIIKGSGNNLQKVFGKFFIFEIPNFQYYHVMSEKIGQYELLKQLIPDLQLLCINNKKEDFYMEYNNNLYINILQILDPYNITIEDILFLENGDIYVEQIFYYNIIDTCYLNQFPNGLEIYQTIDMDQFHVDSFYKTLNVYKKYLQKNDKLAKKIFITRRSINNQTREYNFLINNMQNLTKDQQDTLEQYCTNAGGINNLKKLIKERYITEYDENILENFFESKGYKIIDPYNMSFFEQINAYYNATHIASVRGSGLVNTIFCQENTHVFIINVNNAYNFEYKTVAEIGSNFVYEIPAKRKNIENLPNEFFSVSNIIGILENHYGEEL